MLLCAKDPALSRDEPADRQRRTRARQERLDEDPVLGRPEDLIDRIRQIVDVVGHMDMERSAPRHRLDDEGPR